MRLHFLLTGVLAFATIFSAQAVGVGQIDDFEDGTTQNWIINLLGMGAPPPAALPANVLGGTGGPDDNYLRLTSLGGAGAGSRLAVLNAGGQWAGDYLAAGIDAIQMHVLNLGTTDLALRLLFEDPQVGPPSNIAISLDPVNVPAGGGWQPVVFPTALSDLTPVLGNVEDALKNTTVIRLFHGPDPTFPGAASVAQLGVDNIQATGTVPETGSTMLLLATGAISLQFLRRLKPRDGIAGAPHQ